MFRNKSAWPHARHAHGAARKLPSPAAMPCAASGPCSSPTHGPWQVKEKLKIGTKKKIVENFGAKTMICHWCFVKKW